MTFLCKITAARGGWSWACLYRFGREREEGSSWLLISVIYLSYIILLNCPFLLSSLVSVVVFCVLSPDFYICGCAFSWMFICLEGTIFVYVFNLCQFLKIVLIYSSRVFDCSVFVFSLIFIYVGCVHWFSNSVACWFDCFAIVIWFDVHIVLISCVDVQYCFSDVALVSSMFAFDLVCFHMCSIAVCGFIMLLFGFHSFIRNLIDAQLCLCPLIFIVFTGCSMMFNEFPRKVRCFCSLCVLWCSYCLVMCHWILFLMRVLFIMLL